jgi:8-oxo-dGTP pyrophosphatase MutT (NUDIX family)
MVGGNWSRRAKGGSPVPHTKSVPDHLRRSPPRPRSLEQRLRAVVRPEVSPEPMPEGARRAAAVLLLFDAASPRLPLLFMLRTDRVRHHRGQIGFPGGAVEPEDGSPEVTALREAREELGVVAANVEVIGHLSPQLTATSDLWLTPVVALQRAPQELTPDGFEVAEWFRVDLADLMEAPHRTLRMDDGARRRTVHFYEVAGRTIWGVTGAICHELLTLLAAAAVSDGDGAPGRLEIDATGNVQAGADERGGEGPGTRHRA